MVLRYPNNMLRRDASWGTAEDATRNGCTNLICWKDVRKILPKDV